METITIDGNAGVIDVRAETGYDADATSLLYLDGDAVATDGPDHERPADRVITRAPRPALSESLRITLATGQVGRPLATTLRPLLALLADGRYELGGPERLCEPHCPPDTECPADSHHSSGTQSGIHRQSEIHRPTSADRGPHAGGWHVAAAEPAAPQGTRDGCRLVPTDDWPPADAGRVNYYRAAIRSGHRPSVVLLHLAGAEPGGGFVLDGHHKLAAYRAEEVVPSVVRIARLDTPPADAPAP